MTLHITNYEKEQQKKIVEEISKYSLNVFDDFKRMFPCKGLLLIHILYRYPSPYGGDFFDGVDYQYDGSHKFWKNWNRYKNLKAFL